MTTNVTPGYKDAEARYKAARTDEEKLAALEDMASTLNKHKGTEKLFADIKRRIKELREVQETKAKKRGFAVHVEREGAAQVALVGPPNAGKSSLLAALTKARPEIGAYPYTTRAPAPGMAFHEDVAIQLVDLPPISEEYTESWVYGLVRNADAILLVLDLAGDPLGDLERTRALLLDRGKVVLLGTGERPPDDPRLAAAPTILVGTHLDAAGGPDALEVTRELFPTFPAVGVGAGGQGGAAVTAALFDRLALVRVYAKTPGKEADRSRPFVLHRGDTIVEMAAKVHREFVDRLKFARVWGRGRFDGQRVQRDYVIEDGDVIELHVG